MSTSDVPPTIRALSVGQWLSEWDDVQFDPKSRRERPPESFLLFSMPVGQLRRLTGIERRSVKQGQRREADEAVQRRHEHKRSEEIRRFIFHGYPWSDLPESKRASGEHDHLKMPGWLPGAIIVNIVKKGQKRRGRFVADEDLVEVDGSGDVPLLTLPNGSDDPSWEPQGRAPLEVIDGQHRLFAFEPEDDLSFELPVVAFVGLDVSWQAYVFWTVNITPKRINRSLAFDLYPLLRTVDWLDPTEGHRIYREARAQELTELLWAIEESPWCRRINMLGEGRWGVSQAAWVRSLLATFIKSHRGGSTIGGLYGQEIGDDEEMILPWKRQEQAAFLIFSWRALADAIEATQADWAKSVRDTFTEKQMEMGEHPGELDPAFASKQSLLNTDQGVRGFMYLLNDLCLVSADDLDLVDVFANIEDAADMDSDEEEVRRALDLISKTAVADFVETLCESLASFDWRTSSAEGLDEQARLEKSAFRGSGGYRLLRKALLGHLGEHAPKALAKTSKMVYERLGLGE